MENTKSPMNTENYTYIELSYLYEIAEGDADFVEEMLSDYLANVPSQLEQLSAAITQTDYDSIRFLAHKMKSSLQFLGATAQVDAVHTIEQSALKQQLPEIQNAAHTLTSNMPLLIEELKHKLNHLS